MDNNHPAIANNHPKMANNHPVVASNHPKMANNHPIVASNHPNNGWQTPSRGKQPLNNAQQTPNNQKPPNGQHDLLESQQQMHYLQCDEDSFSTHNRMSPVLHMAPGWAGKEGLCSCPHAPDFLTALRGTRETPNLLLLSTCKVLNEY